MAAGEHGKRGFRQRGSGTCRRLPGCAESQLGLRVRATTRDGMRDRCPSRYRRDARRAQVAIGVDAE